MSTQAVETASLIVAFFALLFGSGWFMIYIKGVKNQAVMQTEHQQVRQKVEEQGKDIAQLKTDVALTNQTVSSIARQMGKLDLITEVNAKMDTFAILVQNVVPRPELEAKISAVSGRVDKVEEVVFHPPHSS